MPTALAMLVSHLKFELTPEARTPLLATFLGFSVGCSAIVCSHITVGSASYVMRCYLCDKLEHRWSSLGLLAALQLGPAVCWESADYLFHSVYVTHALF